MLSEIIHIMEYTLYIYLSVSVGYIVLFSAASHFFKQKKYPATTVRQRFIILVPAYKEDAVIHACVTSVLRQTYPAELYDLIVISDHMRPETNASLRKERIGLIELHEKESSKAKALRIAAETITDQPYDYVLILDADNLISPCYLQELNKAVSQGIKSHTDTPQSQKYEYRHSPIGCRHRRDEQFHLPQRDTSGWDFHLPLPAPEWLSISDGLSGTSSIPIVRAKTKNWKNSCSVKAFTLNI